MVKKQEVKEVKKETKKPTVKKTPKKPAEMTLPVYSLKGEETGRTELPKEIFNVTANPKLLAQYMRVYLTNQREGNASTKTRGQVSGSTKKIYRQKGTGRARHGARKAPIFVGGGIAFGPHPRNFALKITDKQKRRALFGTLTLKYKKGEMLGLENEALKMEQKTKIFAQFLKSLSLSTEKVLLVLKSDNNNLILAARNLPNVKICTLNSINPYLLASHKKIVLTDEVLKSFKDYFFKKDETK